jgi:hypothetical protein
MRRHRAPRKKFGGIGCWWAERNSSDIEGCPLLQGFWGILVKMKHQNTENRTDKSTDKSTDRNTNKNRIRIITGTRTRILTRTAKQKSKLPRKPRSPNRSRSNTGPYIPPPIENPCLGTCARSTSPMFLHGGVIDTIVAGDHHDPCTLGPIAHIRQSLSKYRYRRSVGTLYLQGGILHAFRMGRVRLGKYIIASTLEGNIYWLVIYAIDSRYEYHYAFGFVDNIVDYSK